MPRRSKTHKKTVGSSSQQKQHHCKQRGEQDQDQMEWLLHQMEEQDESEDEEDLNSNDDDGYIDVDLAPLATNFSCPICFNVLRQTRTVTECLHRFCKECIEKAMRKGKHECPVCHVHLPSTRSLRADHSYDQTIGILYGSIRDTREEDVELTHKEKDQNAQMQASFADIQKRLLEALPKPVKIPTTASSSRRNARRGGTRARGRGPNIVIQGSDNNELGESNEGSRESYSSFIQPIMVSDTDEDTEVVEGNAETVGPSIETVRISCELSRGKNAQQSLNVTQCDPGSSSRSSRGRFLTNLVNHLGQHQFEREYMEEEILIVVGLVNLDEALPGLEQEYLSVSPTYPVELLRKHVASQLGVGLKQVQLLHVRQPYFPPSGGTPVYDQSLSSLRLLESDETVGELITSGSNGEALVLGYMLKGSKQ